MENIDLTYLNEISGGDNSFIKEMLDLFIITTAIEVNEFDHLLANSNYEAIGQLAHKMKAPIQMLGASKLFEILRTIEQNGKNRTNIETFPNTINEVKVKIGELTNSIRNLLETM
jgi:HPt (histidine-containing phosphotransfer) domain-containing protein